MAYKWNEQLVGKADNWAYGLLCGYSIFTTAVNVGGIIAIFALYSQCGFGMTMGIALCICQLFFYVTAFMDFCCQVKLWRDNWGFFTCSTTSTYITYMTWTMLASVEDETCNPGSNTVGNTFAQVFIGVLFTLLCIMSMATASRAKNPTGAQVADNKTSALGDAMAEQEDEVKQNADEELAGVWPVSIQTIIFQAIMCLCCLYFGMLFSDWGDAQTMVEVK